MNLYYMVLHINLLYYYYILLIRNLYVESTFGLLLPTGSEVHKDKMTEKMCQNKRLIVIKFFSFMTEAIRKKDVSNYRTYLVQPWAVGTSESITNTSKTRLNHS